MEWEKPSFIEINMSSEIGGYQEDGSDQRIPVPSDTVEAYCLVSSTYTLPATRHAGDF